MIGAADVGLREQAEQRIAHAALARVEDIIATVSSWTPSRQAAVRRTVGDALTWLLREIESGRRSVAQATADIQSRIDGRGPAPPRDPGAAHADELVLSFLLAMKLSREGRLQSICETIFQAVHRFTTR